MSSVYTTYLFTDSGESVKELCCVDDELVEVDQSVSMLQCWNLYVCTYVQLINHSDIQSVTTPHDRAGVWHSHH